MSEAIDAVVAGHLCLDIIPDLSGTTASKWDTLFQPGHLINVGSAVLSTGGAVSNTGLVLHKLGIRTRLAGKLGHDLFGQAIQQIVTHYDPHLADEMIIDAQVSTSYTVIISPPNVDRIFLHCPGANDAFGVGDIDYNRLAETRLFHFGYPPLMRRMYENNGVELTEIFRRAQSTGVTTSLDMAFADPSSAAGRADWASILQATLPYVDIFMPSIEEILYMLRRPLYNQLKQAAGDANILSLIAPDLLSDLSQQIIDLGVKIVGIKLGERGLYLRTASQARIEALGRACPSGSRTWANRELWSPCFQVQVVGTTGSGDATIAGFLSALLRGLSPEKAITAAVAVGACNVEAADALSGIRPWEETLQRVEDGWARRALTVNSPGWRFDPGHQVWNR